MSKKINIISFLLSQVNWFLLILGYWWMGLIGTGILLSISFSVARKRFVSEVVILALLGFMGDYVFCQLAGVELLERYNNSSYLLILWFNLAACFPLIRSWITHLSFPLFFCLAPWSYIGAEKLETIKYPEGGSFYIHAILWGLYAVIVRGFFLKQGYSSEQHKTGFFDDH